MAKSRFEPSGFREVSLKTIFLNSTDLIGAVSIAEQ